MALIDLKEGKALAVWSKVEVTPDTPYCWKFDTKEIYLHRKDGNWFFSELEADSNTQIAVPADQIESSTLLKWSTFVGKTSSSIQALPAFPTRPLVLKPSTPLKILPQNEVLLFVNVPCRVHFYSGSTRPEDLVFESPIKNLSSTWFGEPDNGVLSYSLPFETSMSLQKSDTQNNYSILCPIRVYNASNLALDIQHLLLRCEYLTIYWNTHELCANEVSIKFKGENDLSDVEYINQTPQHISEAVVLTPAQSSKSNNVISKSFHFIKSLASS